MARQNSQVVVSKVVAMLRQARMAKGLSMNVVAQKAGLSQSVVSLIERGLRSPTLDTLVRIASAIETGLGEIVTRAERDAKNETSENI